jgi:hypothetical protein
MPPLLFTAGHTNCCWYVCLFGVFLCFFGTLDDRRFIKVTEPWSQNSVSLIPARLWDHRRRPLDLLQMFITAPWWHKKHGAYVHVLKTVWRVWWKILIFVLVNGYSDSWVVTVVQEYIIIYLGNIIRCISSMIVCLFFNRLIHHKWFHINLFITSTMTCFGR